MSDADVLRKLQSAPTLFTDLSAEQRRIPRGYRGSVLAGEKR